MNSLKNLISAITADNTIANFLSNRLLDDGYRGIQMSQHNRYEMQDVINILNCLSQYGKLEILKGDDNGVYPPEVREYIEFVGKVKELNGKGTLNSIKKNLFPDFHRMGLIDRFNKNGDLIGPYDRSSIRYVKISSIGQQFISESNLKNQYFIFLKSIEKLSKGFIDNVKDLLIATDKMQINEYEMALFATGIGQTFSSQFYSFDDICSIYKKWYNLSKFQRKAIIQIVENWCNERLNLTPKNKQRDFHNWINESQQIISLFVLTPFFELGDNYVMNLVVGDNAKSMFASKDEARRSLIQKKLYYEKHNVQKDPKFILHHIVPLYETETIAEYKLLDCWENMIYIKSDTHSDIHAHDDLKCYNLSFEDNNDVNFVSICDSSFKITAKFSVEAKYDPKLKGLMLEKNTNFLSMK